METRKDIFTRVAKERDTGIALGPGEWSIAELIEHLVLAERGIIASIEKATKPKDPSSIIQKIRWMMVSFILSNGIKVSVSTERVMPTKQLPLESLLSEWNELREKLHSLLDTFTPEKLNAYAFTHKRAGALSTLEALKFINLHLTYHEIRLKKLSNS